MLVILLGRGVGLENRFFHLKVSEFFFSSSENNQIEVFNVKVVHHVNLDRALVSIKTSVVPNGWAGAVTIFSLMFYLLFHLWYDVKLLVPVKRRVRKVLPCIWSAIA